MLQGNSGLPPRAGTDERLPPSSTSNPPVPGGGGGGTSSSPDQEKTKLIQQQLVLLLHAHKCLQRERESENYRCSLPHCQVMKEVFRHIMQCNKTRDCSCESFCRHCTCMTFDPFEPHCTSVLGPCPVSGTCLGCGVYA